MSRASPLILAASLIALLLGLLTGNAGAEANCRAPVPPPRTAALQQYMMVAALTCQAVARNGFAISRRAGSNDRDASVLRSLRDPQYCLVAMTAFLASRDRAKPVAQLAAGGPCTAGVQDSRIAAARLHLQHQALLVGR